MSKVMRQKLPGIMDYNTKDKNTISWYSKAGAYLYFALIALGVVLVLNFILGF